MGRVLAAIHASPKPPGLPSARGWVQWTIGHGRSRDGWRDHPQAQVIEEVIVPAVGRALRRQHVLCHGDFNAGNVLWSRYELSGVVDWETAESAPPAADVGGAIATLRRDRDVLAAVAMARAAGVDAAPIAGAVLKPVPEKPQSSQKPSGPAGPMIGC